MYGAFILFTPDELPATFAWKRASESMGIHRRNVDILVQLGLGRVSVCASLSPHWGLPGALVQLDVHRTVSIKKP